MATISLPTLGYISLAASLAGGAVSAYGSAEQGQAAKAAGQYNSKLALENSAVAQQNAKIAGQAGAQQAGIQGLRNSANIAKTVAGAAASGIDVNSGSTLDTQESERELGLLDAMTIRSNATKTAYSQEVSSENEKAQAALDIYGGETAQTAGEIGAAGTLLGATGSASSNYLRYQLQGIYG